MYGRKPKYIAMFSGGAASAYVAYLMVLKHGKENSVLLFTDTLWEHKDNKRFMLEVAEEIGIERKTLIDGRTPDEVFEDTKFLGNSRLAKCSSQLKVRQTVIYLEELRDSGYEPILYFGIGKHEKRRREGIENLYNHNLLPRDGEEQQVKTVFPLYESNIPDKEIKRIITQDWGIELPEMYHLGFSHANCGGRCVRGGFNHYQHLYETWPQVYIEQEEMENRLREQLGDVSILKRNGKPFTLTDYRRELDLDSEIAKKLNEETDVPCICHYA
jgi:3'-phosphoadenosine 5'-phosphosulfate sulfotransferase (PAPS reductase)/FAD synthetase